MSTTELIEYISTTANVSLGDTLASWMNCNPAFRLFVERNKDKIRKKMGCCKAEADLGDILWELQIGHLLLKNTDLTIEYEPYGKGKVRSPDYRVSRCGANPFNVEAGRIRDHLSQSRLKAWELRIKETIEDVHSDLGVGVRFEFNAETDPKLIGRLESELEQIKTAIRQGIIEADAELKPGQLFDFPISGFQGILAIDVSKPVRKAELGRTDYYGGAYPIFYTQEEFKKFGDTMCEKLGQLRTRMANVLAIGSGSASHEDRHCEHAVTNLVILAARADDGFFRAKGFKGTADFLEQFPNLSAVVFRSSWRGLGAEQMPNFVWLNPHAAHPLEDEISEYLRRMD